MSGEDDAVGARRILADLAISEPETFAGLVAAAKAALPKDVNAKADAA